jgi:hypothetical protein
MGVERKGPKTETRKKNKQKTRSNYYSLDLGSTALFALLRTLTDSAVRTAKSTYCPLFARLAEGRISVFEIDRQKILFEHIARKGRLAEQHHIVTSPFHPPAPHTQRTQLDFQHRLKQTRCCPQRQRSSSPM